MNALTKPAGKMHSIEAARAIAALSVMCMHAAHFMRVPHFSGHIGLGDVFWFGYLGVDFFFVLSGFIITYVHFHDLGHRERLHIYLWRRFSRIYPIYWCVLTLCILLTTAARLVAGSGLSFDMGIGDLWGTVFLVMGGGEPKYLGVAWSLQYEILFYVLFCVLLVNRRLGCAAFALWGLCVFGVAIGAIDWVKPFGMWHPHCLQFLFGVAVGFVARRQSVTLFYGALPLALLAFVLAVLFEGMGPFGEHSSMGRIVVGLASALILLVLVSLEQQRAIHTPAWLAGLGAVSYSIYLGHGVFLNLTYSVLLKLGLYHVLPEVVVYGAAIVVALGGTVLIGYKVELPLVEKNRALQARFAG